MRVSRVSVVSIALALAGTAAIAEGTGSGIGAGLDAYFRGRFEVAAVALKGWLRSAGAAKDTVGVEAASFFVGRSFAELGLRGLALHYLTRAEGAGGLATRRLARREVARIYFQAADYAPVLEVFARAGADEQDDELSYLAGVAAAAQSSWGRAEEILARIGPSSALRSYALYVIAQSHAAREDFAAAVSDLRALAASRALPPGLADQARILEGKILYLQGKDAEGRASFAAVRGGGAQGYEAVRGLLLTGAGVEAASRVESAIERPHETAVLLLVRAVAAERSNRVGEAAVYRQRIRRLVRKNLDGVRRIAANGPEARRLDGDLARFAALVRDTRWAEGLEEERRSLPAALAADATPAAPAIAREFRPEEAAFYAVWERSRSDPWLRGLVELSSRCRALAASFAAAPGDRPFWAFWRSSEDARLARALLGLQLANVGQLLADHLHTFGVESDVRLRERKRAEVEAIAADLRLLYLGRQATIPPLLSNLEKSLEYKQGDMLRLIDAIPERSTDSVISLLGNTVDLLTDLRERLRSRQLGDDLSERERDALLERWKQANRALESEIERQIERAIAPVLRAEEAFYARVEADNDGSLSRLYARSGAAAGEKGSSE